MIILRSKSFGIVNKVPGITRTYENNVLKKVASELHTKTSNPVNAFKNGKLSVQLTSYDRRTPRKHTNGPVQLSAFTKEEMSVGRLPETETAKYRRMVKNPKERRTVLGYNKNNKSGQIIENRIITMTDGSKKFVSQPIFGKEWIKFKK